MSFTAISIRDAEAILDEKNMYRHVIATLEYIDENLAGFSHSGEMLRMALEDMNWRQDNESRRILDGRRYQYKGMLNRVALEANLSVYEFIHEGLLRLQIGYDKGVLDTGVLLLTGKRSPRSSLGAPRDLVCSELDALYPTISVPVLIGLLSIDPLTPDTETVTEEPIHAINGHIS